MARTYSYVLLFFVACIAFFPHNTALRPDIMECRNLVTAREIAQGDCSWQVPMMNGALRLEKPPLPTWIAAMVEYVSPNNLGLQRVPPALAAMLWVLFLFLLVKRLADEKTALIVSLVFLTCYQIVLMGRTATWDVYCHAFMMGAIYFLYKLLYPMPTDQRSWLTSLFMGVMLGLSFLSKGPVSFFALLLPFLLALPMKGRASLGENWGKLVLAVMVCLVIGSWWYIYLYMYHPVELTSVFHQETGAWTNHNVRPWWYYWRFWVEAGLWAPFVLVGLAFPYWKKRVADGNTYMLMLVFLVAQLVLLSMMPEKKYRYLLPMMVPMAMLVGYLLTYWITQGANWPRRLLIGAVGTCVVVELLALPVVGRVFNGEQTNTLTLLSHDERVNGLSFFHPADEDLRIECVYNLRHRVGALDLSDEASLRSQVPCVLLVKEERADSLVQTLPQDIAASRLGTYDDNHHHRKAKHYNPSMCHKAFILSRANEKPSKPTDEALR